MPRHLLLLVLLASLAFAARSPEQQAAVDLYNQRKNTEARAAFEKLVAADAKNAEAWHYLGQLALRADDPETAVKHAEKAVALEPNNSAYHQRLGDAYGRSAQKASMLSQMGLARKCKAAYEKAVELDPRNIEARFSLLSYYQQAPGIVGGGMDKALAQAQEIKRLDPVRGRSALAGVHIAEKKYDLAFAEYDAVLRETPDDYAAHYQIGRIAALSGQQLDRGLASLRRCLAMTPPAGQPDHAVVHYRIGGVFEKMGDKAAAKSAYETALKLAPQFAQAADALKKLK